MKALKQSSGPSSARGIVTAFAIWFAHFMVIWAAGEIWPNLWTANALAWGFTAMALVAVGVQYLRLRAQLADGGLRGWSYRLARGAIAMATVAVVFSAFPSFVFLP